jgi:diguanylate cyclase (GGDEF)-like protein
VKTRLKTIFFLLIIFIIANASVFYMMETNKEQRIQVVLDSKLEQLQTSYEILLYNQKMVADATYASTIKLTPRVIDILKKASKASKREKKNLRKELRRVLAIQYDILKNAGVLQYQFVLPNNESFLRMHKLDKFGDDISKIRKDFVYTNKTHKIKRGFFPGSTTSAFRNIYPIFDTKHHYIGAMEVSFSAQSVQQYLTSKSKLHTYFLVDKEIFNSLDTTNDDLVLKYFKNGNDDEVFLNLDTVPKKQKCIIQNRIKLKSVYDKVVKSIAKSKGFAVYSTDDITKVDVVAFYPIKNEGSDKAVAWLVSYGESPFIYETLAKNYEVHGIVFVVLLIVMILIYNLIIGKYKMAQKNEMVQDVLNSSDDIIFATDFKTVDLANERFKRFFGLQEIREIARKKDGNILNIFEDAEGSLVPDKSQDPVAFVDMVVAAKEEEKIVTIKDSLDNAKEFHIHIVQTCHDEHGVYLITLMDSAKRKEQERLIQERAFKDDLTSLYNDVKFKEVVESEFKRDARYKRDLSIAFIDLDGFETLLDESGKTEVESLLVLIANYLAQTVRETDVVARWDKHRFAILFPETNKEDLEATSNKLKDGIEKLTHPTVVEFSVSFGITQYEDRDTLENLFGRCERALVEALEHGHNQVCVK